MNVFGMTNSTPIERALDLARRGYEVFPLHGAQDGRCTCQDTQCSSSGKHPLTRHGFKEATRDEKVIRDWWQRWPMANIGIRTGRKAGFLVLDVDARNSGEETLLDLLSENGPLPDTVEVVTGGGRHIYFEHPDCRVRSGTIAPGLDLKADGGYVVAPGSTHVNGRLYEWEASSHPDDIPLVPIPNWLLDIATRSRNGAGPVGDAAVEIPRSRRNSTLASLAGTMRHRGMSEEAIEAALITENEVRCKPPLEESEVRRVAQSIGNYAPRPTEEVSDAPIPFHTGAEIAAQATEGVDYIGPPYLVAGAITEVVGKIKVAGKTTFVAHLCRALLDGEPFLGRPTKKTPVVYLTEQPRSSFDVAMRRAGLMGREDFHVLYSNEVRGVPWTQVAQAAVERAHRVGALVIVTDTLGPFAGLRGDAENSAGAALEAIAPLQDATASGIAIVVVRHERKSGGDIVDAGRGSSAFGGAVDVVLSIRRGEGNTRSTIRVLEGISRFDEMPDKEVVEWDNGRYIHLGTDTQVALAEAKQKICDTLPSNEGDAMTIKELETAADIKRNTAQRALAELMENGVVCRTGAGKSRDSYRYYKLSAVYKSEVSADRSSPEPAEKQSAETMSPSAEEEPPHEQNASAETSTIYPAEGNKGEPDDLQSCRKCRAHVDYYDEDGRPWCSQHGPQSGTL